MIRPRENYLNLTLTNNPYYFKFKHLINYVKKKKILH